MKRIGAVIILLSLARPLAGQPGGEGRASEISLKDRLAAVNRAADAGKAAEAAPAALEVARLLEQAAPGDTSMAGEAERLYRYVIGLNGREFSELRQTAVNNLGVLYLRQGNFAEAAGAFGQFDFEEAGRTLGAADVARIRYNYGRTLEDSGKPAEAYLQFKQALNFKPALSRAIEMVPDASGMRELCGGLAERGDPRGALDCLHGTLPRFASDPAGTRPLGLIVATYRALMPDSAAFFREEDVFLRELQLSATGKTYEPALGQLRDGLLGKFSAKWSPLEFRGRFGAWLTADATVFSGLLADLGALDQKAGKTVAALGRYAAAWAIYPGNLDAASAYIEELNERPTVAPEGSSREVIGSLFPGVLGKSAGEVPPGGAGLKAEASHASAEQVFRLHLALGTVAERQMPCRVSPRIAGQGAGVGLTAQDDPNTALFHWIRADIADQKAREATPSRPRSFFLYKHLTSCFARKDSEYTTWHNYQREAFQSSWTLNKVRDKWNYHSYLMAAPESIFRIGVQAGLNQWLDTPTQWGQGTEGFARRYASSLAVREIRQAMAFAVDATLDEDPHFMHSGQRNMGARVRNVFRQTFLCSNSSGDYTFSMWRVSSAIGSELLSNSWRPAGTNRVGDALGRSGFVIAGDLGANAVKEFLPDIKRIQKLRWTGKIIDTFIK